MEEEAAPVAQAATVEEEARASAPTSDAPSQEPYLSHCTLDPQSLRIFYVKHNGASSSASSDDAEVTKADQRASDEGLASSLEDTTTVHIASCLWCTCQYFNHWGLPCDHQQRVMLQLNFELTPNGAVHRRWLPSEEERIERRRLGLQRSTLAAMPAPVHVPAGTRMTADERRADIHNLGAVLGGLAATSSSLHAQVRARLDPLLRDLMQGTAGVRDSYGKRMQQDAAA